MLPTPEWADTSRAIDPIELYAAAIDTSDYVRQVAPLVHRLVPAIGDLLDVGAGGGQLGQALRDRDRRWTAIEPSCNMRARLGRLDHPPQLVASGWENADVAPRGYDTVLAANIAALTQEADAFLACCRQWARRRVVWVVAAQSGPRGLCFAGCLPAHWHGEDETPGVDITLRALPPAERPQLTAEAEWTFSAVVADLGALATYLADRLGWLRSDARRAELAVHLTRLAKHEPAGYRLDIPRRSAVLVWGAS